MQGINISNVMTQAYRDVSKYSVFFFEGTMPADLQSVPFDPTSLADLRDNCVAMTFNQESKDLVRSGGQTQVGIDARDPHLAITDTPLGFSASNLRVPISWMGYVTETEAAGIDSTYDPTLAAPDLSTTTNFAELEAIDEAKDIANNESFRRVGRAGSFAVVDFGSNPKQDYDARLYYYITTAADDLFKDDTVFPYHLNKIQTAEPGVYDNTFLFNNETTYYDEHNQEVIQRAYDVDLLAGGTQTVTIYMVRNDAFVNQTETPRVSPELVTDTTQGFMEHDIPQQQIPLLLSGMTMVQQTTYSRQKRPSWTGSNVYYRRCITARIDTWDPTLNEGAGGWVIGDNFDTNTDGLVKEFTTPISATRYIRMYCIYGPQISGYIIVAGDPHWSLGNFGFYTKAPEIIYDPLDMNVDLTWAIVVPVVDTFDESQPNANSTLSYSTKSNMAPILMCDVGLPDSGAAIEVQETNFMSQARPRITKMNFVFND